MWGRYVDHANDPRRPIVEVDVAIGSGTVQITVEAVGDLAVEVGYERLAEVQEEILWVCEAAHVPVIWATQVLDSLARTGLPSRAEVTDAAMAERAEAVMLNKGPFVVDTIVFLSGVLGRMQEHVSKKRTLLRQLRSWDLLSEDVVRPGSRGNGTSRPPRDRVAD